MVCLSLALYSITMEDFIHINNYRLNTFTIRVDSLNGQLLYNTATGAIVLLRNENDLRTSFDKLKDMYFYVPLDFDDVKWVDQMRETQTKSFNKFFSGYTIFTTLDCNARCFYCYEKGQPKISMTITTANDVADFIIKSSGSMPIDLRWFGGEPLVNEHVIDIISRKLLEHNITYSASMVSNGLLFTDSIIHKAKQLWNLKRVQITLDGTKDIYQRTKAYKDATGKEFEKVIHNIDKLTAAKIKVSIRLNQDLYNTTDLFDLVDLLSSKFRGHELVSVYNCLIYNRQNTCNMTTEAKRWELYEQLQNKLQECGWFSTNKIKRNLRYFHCMADNDSSIVITPNGDIGKCEHFTNQHLIGDIYNPQLNQDKILEWKERYQPTQECYKCPLYPQCIRIKMCPEERDSCTRFQCENKIKQIKNALKNKYNLILDVNNL